MDELVTRLHLIEEHIKDIYNKMGINDCYNGNTDYCRGQLDTIQQVLNLIQQIR